MSQPRDNEKDETNPHSCGNVPSHWTYSPVIAPLYMTTTFENLDPGQSEFEYSRSDNPTRSELQLHLKSLESAKYALAFSSGLGSLTTCSYLLKSGDHVLCCDDVYGGVNRFFSKAASRMGIETTMVNGIELEEWTKNFKIGQTKMVWIETPTNPMMKVLDIAAISKALKSIHSECIVVVDNTFMTPVLQRPLMLGADIVMHSVTKYINGHSDVIMGALMTNNEELFNKLKFFQNALGIVPSAHDCSQVIRSILTLELRVHQQSRSALEVAKYLETNPLVSRVIYPGLKSHPQHELALRQSLGHGFSGIISIYVGSDDGSQAEAVLQHVKLFKSAVSLGCVHSLIQIPSRMTHTAVPEAQRSKLGMTNNLLRLSIGVEPVALIIEDLKQALEKSAALS